MTGKGQVIAISDSGLDTGDTETLHLDFQEKVTALISYPIHSKYNKLVLNPGDDNGASDKHSGHGTHVAGSALGNGRQAQARGISIKGIAPEAKLFFQSIEQTPRWKFSYILKCLEIKRKLPPNYDLCGLPKDLRILFEAAYTTTNDGSPGARIYSMSWGRSLYPKKYDDFCDNLDDFVWNKKDFLIVAAAGNFDDCVASPGLAKNCLTVGASENNRAEQFSDTYKYRWPDCFPDYNNGLADSIDDIAPFSNRGPCETGRRKPDLVAPGTFILSTRSSQIPHNHFAERPFPEAEPYYMYMHGTSMATPLVAGSVALVREYLQDYKTRWDSPKATLIQGNPENPTAALIKAILIHSAEYLTSNVESSLIRADDHQGWGRINLGSVLNPLSPTRVLFIDATEGLKQGEACNYHINLTNNSVPLRVTLVYTDAPGENLVNDLNLILYSPNGQYYWGNDFEGTQRRDPLNNVEGCFIQAPETGQWRVKVVATNITQDSQDYALVISGGEVCLTQPS